MRLQGGTKMSVLEDFLSVPTFIFNKLQKLGTGFDKFVPNRQVPKLNIPTPSPSPLTENDIINQYQSHQISEDQANSFLNSQPSSPQVPTPQPSPQLNSSLSGYQSATPPPSILDLILKAAGQSHIDPNVLAAILYHESAGTFDPSTIAGPVGNQDIGIAQINELAHPDVTRAQALDPYFAVPYASNLLKSNMDYFGGDLNRAIAAYNVGKGGASIAGQTPFGGGPSGQYYLDNIARNLAEAYVAQLGLKTTPGYR